MYSNFWYSNFMHYLGSFYLFIMFAKNKQSRLDATQNILS